MATITSTSESRSTTLTPVLTRSFVLNWEVVAYVAIFSLAIFTRFYHLGDRVMSHDESLHTRYSYNLYANGDYQHTPLMHGPILFHFVALSYTLFGDNDFTARIYPAVLGILLVMFPLLFRRWLGRWGSLLASLMVLISPLLMYYNRYIREDTPSIFYSLIMFYCILMYLNGSERWRHKSFWLYILAAAMLGSLGSKEVAFFYIAIFASFVFLYWLARMAQVYLHMPGKSIFYILVIAILLGGVAALGMYVILDIVPPDTAISAAQAGGWLGNVESRSFIVWTVMVIVSVVAALVGTLVWVYADRIFRINWSEVALIIAIGLITCLGMIVMEQISHISPDASTTAAPVIPGQSTSTITVTSTIRVLPLILDWLLGLAAVGFLLFTRSTPWWQAMKAFPELDILMVMGTLVLPWLAAIVPFVMKGSPDDYSAIGQAVPQFLTNWLTVKGSQEVGQVVVGFLAWIPFAMVAIVAGLVWDWKRWLVCAGVFHLIFAFFFTTMFTNIPGLATGMYYSLGYWLEQQGVRRGSQPQYYYLVVIMPIYEFLPVIGSILAMVSGLTIFWRLRRNRQDELEGEKPKHDVELSMMTGAVPVEETPSVAQIVGDDAEIITDETPAVPAEEVCSAQVLSELGHLPLLLYFSWWAILNLVFYTLAGEKMPWLGTHLTLPLIFLSAWYFGGIISKIDLSKFKERGWLYLVLFPLLFITMFQMIFPLLTGQAPFAGLQQDQLEHTYSWLAYVVLTGAIIFGVFWLAEKTGWRHFRVMFGTAVFVFLAVITFRAAWMASMINYDYATEFLVYAHGAPAVKTVLAQLQDISERTTDGMALKFAYDDKVSWPYSWYFRHFNNAVFVGSNPTNQNLKDAVAVIVGDENRPKVEPLLQDRYIRFDYIRLWWPMQDYFGLTGQRVANTLDFSPDNPQAAQIRQGIWDIWWARDYTAYGAAVQKNFNVTQWPVSDHMYFYVRKDVAAKVWNYGTGNGTVVTAGGPETVNQCNANWVQRPATLVFNTASSPLNHPVGLAFAPNGMIYAAEEGNQRISIFNTQGVFQGVVGQQGGGNGVGAFTRPDGVAIAANGSIYVADTWNYRMQAFTSAGQFVNMWGRAGEFGADAPVDPKDAFWAPRAVAVDSQRVYVADTGNKRIRVYDLSGQYLYDIGSGGSQEGQLDEPVGVVASADGRVFVADTWNDRISVFRNDGTYLSSFKVSGWYQDLGNRPYLALDPKRNLLYVGDPDGGRVLVYDTSGNCVGSFGQLNNTAPDLTQFSIVGGIAVDDQGFVYVADSGSGRILKFDPFIQAVPPSGASVQPEATSEVTQEASVPKESTAEVKPPSESTAQVQPSQETTSEAQPGTEATPEATPQG